MNTPPVPSIGKIIFRRSTVRGTPHIMNPWSVTVIACNAIIKRGMTKTEYLKFFVLYYQIVSHGRSPTSNYDEYGCESRNHSFYVVRGFNHLQSFLF